MKDKSVVSIVFDIFFTLLFITMILFALARVDIPPNGFQEIFEQVWCGKGGCEDEG